MDSSVIPNLGSLCINYWQGLGTGTAILPLEKRNKDELNWRKKELRWSLKFFGLHKQIFQGQEVLLFLILKCPTTELTPPSCANPKLSRFKQNFLAGGANHIQTVSNVQWLNLEFFEFTMTGKL